MLLRLRRSHFEQELDKRQAQIAIRGGKAGGKSAFRNRLHEKNWAEVTQALSDQRS